MTLPSMIGGLTRDVVLDWCTRIDRGPYASLAVGERITFPNVEMTTTLSFAAAATSRVRLCFTLVVLPMHPAALIAKQVATLDVLSGGRVSVGVGVGGREEDYRALEARWEGRVPRLARQVATMRRIWRGERPFDDASAPIGPMPVQPGGPEVLVGALLPSAVRRAAPWADGLLGFSFGPDPAEVGAAFETARAAWRDAGRPAPRLVTSCWFALGSGGRAQMDAYARRYLGIFGDDLAGSLAALCTTVDAAALRDVVARVRDLGADELLLVPTSADPHDADRVADLLG